MSGSHLSIYLTRRHVRLSENFMAPHSKINIKIVIIIWIWILLFFQVYKIGLRATGYAAIISAGVFMK